MSGVFSVSKVWFVTGSSRGLGRAFVEAALMRGDRVAATARDIDALADLRAAHGDSILPLVLDVTDRAGVPESVRRAHEYFGRIDVVVNNAGVITHGAVEEMDEEHLSAQLETNLFGPVRVVRAALPYLREQGSGHVVQISSVAGLVAYPTLGGYHASKWALEGISEALAGEVAQFGIKVTIVEPGAYATGLGASSERSTPLPEYDSLRAALRAGHPADQVGDPAAAAQALLRVVDADDPPLRIIFSGHEYHVVQEAYVDRAKAWSEWAELSAAAQGS